jgi:two-component system, NtrC family, sensor histidine kinase KinB
MSHTASLRSRIRNSILILVVLVVLLGAYALPRVYRLGGAIRETLYRNYVSIEAAEHMHAALRTLELAELNGHARQALARSQSEFMHWMNVENHDFTEAGEPQLAHDIESRARKLFTEVGIAPPGARHERKFTQLHDRIDALIEMNRAAMFRADSRALALGKRLTYQFAAGLAVLLLVGGALSWGVGWALSKPLTELADRLHGISQRHTHLRLGPQRLAELDTVARAFNQMAEQLERYEAMNVERLVYEKNKIEAIIESLEDGVVLVGPDGVVTHINEIAAIILGVDRKDALGSPFDDLSSNHPHYLRIRDALRTLARSETEPQRVEVQLHVRGREHSYVLKPVALRPAEGPSFGTLLILQDVTYLRDQDRARTNLVATLSHELRTPLTSIALAAELLEREQARLSEHQRELVGEIRQDCARMKQLADNLMSLARGGTAAITLKRERLDLARIVNEAVGRFTLQAHEKRLELTRRVEEIPAVSGDPIKLSWVVSNLIGNAMRYTPEGGRITVSAEPRDGGVRLEVADSGPGIPPEIRGYIFERFAQYGPNGDQRGAAGLGLAIVKEIVEAHGGRIFLTSDDSGSTFVVELPAAEV